MTPADPVSRVDTAEIAKTLNRAVAHHEAGNLTEAQTLYRDVLAQQPNNADALHLLGALGHQTGHHDAAVDLIGRAIAIQSDDADFYNNRGEALRALGRSSEARTDYDRAIALRPSDPGYHYNLGILLAEDGALDEAAQQLRKALEIEPDYPEAHNSLGIVLANHGDLTSAIEHLRKAIEIDPDFAEFHTNLGNALARDGAVPEAIDHYRRAIELEPDAITTHADLAELLRLTGRTDEALDAYRRAHEIDPQDPRIRLGTALTFADADRTEAAEPLLREALSADPSNAEATMTLGYCLDLRGEFEEAMSCYERALELHPGLASTRAQLANLRRHTARPEDIAAYEDLLRQEGLSAAARANLAFAAADICDGAGEFDKAFDYYRRANDLRKASEPFDRSDYRAYLEKLKSVFTKDLIETKGDFGASSDLPIFIVGMPRSGTTLVEQIVSSHPQAFGGGELDDIPEATRILHHLQGHSAPYPDCIPDLEQETIAKVADVYLERLRSLSADAARVTDKMPGNFLHLGFIALAFPKARIIHCRRDPLDTCLSCYFTNFQVSQPFANDLDDLAFYYGLYQDLMDHWRDVVGDRFVDVDYEGIVTAQEDTSRRLLEHCGLPWDERCLEFHRNDRRVATASRWQVRQPLFASSMGRWRHYEAHLKPLRTALDI